MTYFELTLFLLFALGIACAVHELYEPKMEEGKLKQYLKRITNRDKSKKENLFRGIQWHTRFIEERE